MLVHWSGRSLRPSPSVIINKNWIPRAVRKSIAIHSRITATKIERRERDTDILERSRQRKRTLSKSSLSARRTSHPRRENLVGVVYVHRFACDKTLLDLRWQARLELRHTRALTRIDEARGIRPAQGGTGRGNKSIKGGFRVRNRGRRACLRRVSVFGAVWRRKQAGARGAFGAKRCEFLKKGEAWPCKAGSCCKNF